MFTQRLSLSNQDARRVSTTKLHQIGSVAETADGRVYCYASSAGVALAAGKVNTAGAAVANHLNCAVATAAAVGARQVRVTLGATAATSGQYEGGYLVVSDAAGVGSAYLIAGNPAIASSGTGTIELAEGIATALTTSSKVSFHANPFANSVVSASAVALHPNGTNNVAVTASSFYWSQVGGIASVLSDGIITKGAGAILSDAVAGAVEIEVATSVVRPVGYAIEATVDTKYNPVYLTLS